MQPTKLISRHKFACDLERKVTAQWTRLNCVFSVTLHSFLQQCVLVMLMCTWNVQATARWDLTATCGIFEADSSYQVGHVCFFFRKIRGFIALYAKSCNWTPFYSRWIHCVLFYKYIFWKIHFCSWTYIKLSYYLILWEFWPRCTVYITVENVNLFITVSWVLIYFWSNGTLASPCCYVFPATCEILGPCRDDDDDDDEYLWYLTPCRSVYD